MIAATDIMKDIETQIYLNRYHKLTYELNEGELVISVIYEGNEETFLEIEWLDRNGNTVISRTVDYDDVEATELAVYHVVNSYDYYISFGIIVRE